MGVVQPPPVGVATGGTHGNADFGHGGTGRSVDGIDGVALVCRCAQRGARLVGAEIGGPWVRCQKALNPSCILPGRGDRSEDDDSVAVAVRSAHGLGETQVARRC